MKLVYFGKVKENGSMHIFNRKAMIEDVQCFLGKQIKITIEKKKNQRSLEQNAYYWGVVVPMVRQGMIDTGYKIGKEETHDFIKLKFIKKELVNESTGEILQSIGSTTELTTTGFMELIADIQQWAAEYLSIKIPDPGEQVNIEFE